METSSSRHSLNADFPLSWPKKGLFLWNNWRNIQKPEKGVDSRLRIQEFRCKPSESVWESLPASNSPSRKLSNLFWMHLPWEKMEQQLGSLRVVDLGCGSGRYAQMFSNWSGGRIRSYHGLDVKTHPDWDKTPANAQMPQSFSVIGKKGPVAEFPEGTNLIFTQSSLEHVENDLEFFESVRKWVEERKQPTVQVHLIPSEACWWLYPFHGVRQYTPRTLSTILKTWGEGHRFSLFRMGGENCNRLHFRQITLPSRFPLLRSAMGRKDSYAKECREAIERDWVDGQEPASFYAFVIESYTEGEIF